MHERYLTQFGVGANKVEGFSDSRKDDDSVGVGAHVQSAVNI